MNYANINIDDIIDTYQYAERPEGFDGFPCDGDKQTVEPSFTIQ